MIISFEVKSRECLIDSDDVDLLEVYWGLRLPKNGYTAYLQKGRSSTRSVLHRVVMERVLGRPIMRGEDVDHIDKNGLNNTRSNLRIATRSQNQANSRVHKHNKLGIKGVYPKEGRYAAQIRVNKVRMYLGTFDTPELAQQAYLDAARKHYGEFASKG